VTPEYNHGVPGVLKNAIDYLYAEWANKGVGFVSYGVAGGARAVEHLRTIAGNLNLADVAQQVTLHMMTEFECATQGTWVGQRPLCPGAGVQRPQAQQRVVACGRSQVQRMPAAGREHDVPRHAEREAATTRILSGNAAAGVSAAVPVIR
jgi:multimeric flavodoxin WrbA